MKKYSFNEQTLGQILADKARTHGDKVFLQYEDEQEISYEECNKITDKIASGLRGLGLKEGDTLATFMPNCLEAIYFWFGAAKVGVIDVPINLSNKGYFLKHILNDSAASTLVIDHCLLDRLISIEDDLPHLKTVILLSKNEQMSGITELKLETIKYQNFIASSPAESIESSIKGSDPQMIIYTSGTTGPAKGVLQPHSMIYLNALEYIENVHANENDVFFTCLPMCHANARILCVYPALLLGIKVVIYKKFSATKFWSQIRKAKATIFNSLGTLASFLNNQPEKGDDYDNPVRVCAAFPMPPQICMEFKRRFNLEIVEGYGLTEVGLITYNSIESHVIGSCGKATKSFEVQIFDENDWPLPAGTVGEIVARGKIPWATSLGYLNNPEKTVELVRNHYYHTGDSGFLDENGYLFFCDRIKDYIRRRGENISSTEIEYVVDSHPSVVESAAISVNSEISEDEIKIVVVLNEGEKLKPEDLLKFCEERMPYFAVPRYVEYVKKLPKTPNGKVMKAALRQFGVTNDTWDRDKLGCKI